MKIEEAMEALLTKKVLAVDTETTGLNWYHRDVIFSIIIHDGEKPYYFNRPDDYQRELLSRLFIKPDILWYMHNARFDLHMLSKYGLFPAGDIHCTQTMARLEYNDHMSYNLGSCGSRIGYPKSNAVEEFIKKHRLYETIDTGKKTTKKNKLFVKVPYRLIRAYAERDAEVTYRLGEHQQTFFKESKDEQRKLPSLHDIVRNEKRLLPVVFGMEKLGIRLDKQFIMSGARFQEERAAQASARFTSLTGADSISATGRYPEIFSDQKSNWVFTDKGNPSFDSNTLEKFDGEPAQLLRDYRDAKSRHDFFVGLDYHADKAYVIHPSFNPSGTVTGRFTSSNPNFQNIKKNDKDSDLPEVQESFNPRQALIPREGFVFYELDYSQIEYRLMLELAAKLLDKTTKMVEAIQEGLDFHQATANLAGITRSEAKTCNFAIVYGSGIKNLAKTLDKTEEEAKKIQTAVFDAAPEIGYFINQVCSRAKRRGVVYNWVGRRFHFPDTRFAYRAPNYLCQGGAADIIKIAVVNAYEYLRGKKSNMLLTVHDSVLFEVHRDEQEIVKDLKKIMESAYTHSYVPMKTSVEYSDKSYGQLEEITL